jgi:hypothetical protein
VRQFIALFGSLFISAIIVSSAFATHWPEEVDSATNREKWQKSPWLGDGWDGGLNNGVQVWDNVWYQSHNFLRTSSEGILAYRPENTIDGKHGTFAFTWETHGGIAFDPAETWHLNIQTSPGLAAVDLWSIAAHEFGHTLSLDHEPLCNACTEGPTMVNTYGYGKTWMRSLEPKDRDDIQRIYPCATCKGF